MELIVQNKLDSNIFHNKPEEITEYRGDYFDDMMSLHAMITLNSFLGIEIDRIGVQRLDYGI
jgi:hypothetical protein